MTDVNAPSPLMRCDNRPMCAAELISCALMFALSYFVFYSLCLRPSSDISIHATWAAEGVFTQPDSFFHHGTHCMWHVFVALLLRLQIPLPVAAALVTAACKAIELWLVERLFSAYLSDRLKRGAIIALSAVAVTVSAICVPQYNPTVYVGAGTPNTWHSSTQLIAMVWMLLCITSVARCYETFEGELHDMGDKANVPWKQAAVMGAMLFLSLFAKPTFMQVFLPAACLFFGIMWLKHSKNGRFFTRVIICVLPAVIMMVLQYMYYFGIIVPHQSSMVLELSPQKALNVLVRTLLMQAFPIYALVACSKRGGKDTLYWLTLVFDIVGILEFLIFGESGRRAADGNFGWGMMGAALMLWIVALIRFARCVSDDLRETKRLRPWHAGGALLLIWHIASGVYYIVYLLTNVKVAL